MAIDVARARSLAAVYLVDIAEVRRGDPQASAGFVNCRLETYPSGGENLLDTTGSATHLLRAPAGTDLQSEDEVIVNAGFHYLVLATNAGRSLAYDTQAACVRQG